MIWILQLALLLAACGNHAASVASSSPSPSSPAPTPTKCWIYDKIYPATEAAFDSQHLTSAERKEIEKWSAPASPVQARLVKVASPWATSPTASEAHLVRWMRSPWDRSLLIFVARPLTEPGSSWHSPWLALNGNVFIDPVTCDMGAYPTAWRSSSVGAGKFGHTGI